MEFPRFQLLVEESISDLKSGLLGIEENYVTKKESTCSSLLSGQSIR